MNLRIIAGKVRFASHLIREQPFSSNDKPQHSGFVSKNSYAWYHGIDKSDIMNVL
jgi:hypothetical protein